MSDDSTHKFRLWKYEPSVAAAAIFMVLFIGTTFFHVYQMIRKRSLFFVPLVIGGVFEFLGYLGRILAHNNQTSLSFYIMQTLLLLVAPALFAASIYMILGRMIAHTKAESLAPIRRTWLTKIFVLGDVFSFLVQAGGGGLLAQASSQNTGKKIVIAGLFIQIVMFGVFMITSGILHRRLSSTPTNASLSTPWRKYMYSLYFASALILVRSIFRVAEFLGGQTGTLMTHEVYLYIFDGVLMFGTMIVFNVVHLGNLIGSKQLADETELNDGSDS
ncbi:hypothetical protein HYALB_00000512 [Hymenoscyphus albidus]|uniref:RTA1 like protein n=1 Tax=Hymenoscyphus albidus TaxID=595503 RepID=A0A9N9LXY5_9HELO|nr:hypothetical protein HYALB_00000512 [Hymenoscyphus albidus]